MTLSVAERNLRAGSTAAKVTHVTLYNGDPFGAGVEVAGITRVAIAWNAAAAGAAAQTAPVSITVPVGASFDHLVGMTALVAGTAIAKRAVAAQHFVNGGTVDVTVGAISG